MDYSNTDIADAIDMAVDLLERKRRVPTRSARGFWSEFTCVHVDQLAREGDISEQMRRIVIDEIHNSIRGYYTFNGYYKKINGLPLDATVADDVMIPARIIHMRRLAKQIRNR